MGNDSYDCVIVGSGPGGLGAAFHLARKQGDLSVLVLDQEAASTGGLRNDCKMNFTYPTGFPTEYWSREQGVEILGEVEEDLRPRIMATKVRGTSATITR